MELTRPLQQILQEHADRLRQRLLALGGQKVGQFLHGEPFIDCGKDLACLEVPYGISGSFREPVQQQDIGGGKRRRDGHHVQVG